jgi:hypothetical protein
MIGVIQCAASKRVDAGHPWSADGKPVTFVAAPHAAPADPAHKYARPDDPAGTGLSWRQVLAQYNREPETIRSVSVAPGSFTGTRPMDGL